MTEDAAKGEGGGKAPAGAWKLGKQGSKMKAAAQAAKSIAKIKDSQKEHRQFNPSLGDQAVRLLDSAIETFRKRRHQLLRKVAEDEADLVQMKKDIANCDWHINKIKNGMSERQERLEAVKTQLEKFGVRPDDDDEDGQARSIMPVLDYAASATKNSNLEMIRTGMRHGNSVLEYDRGYTLQEGLPVHPKDTLPLPAAHIRAIKTREATRKMQSPDGLKKTGSLNEPFLYSGPAV